MMSPSACSAWKADRTSSIWRAAFRAKKRGDWMPLAFVSLALPGSDRYPKPECTECTPSNQMTTDGSAAETFCQRSQGVKCKAPCQKCTLPKSTHCKVKPYLPLHFASFVQAAFSIRSVRIPHTYRHIYTKPHPNSSLNFQSLRLRGNNARLPKSLSFQNPTSGPPFDMLAKSPQPDPEKKPRGNQPFNWMEGITLTRPPVSLKLPNSWQLGHRVARERLQIAARIQFPLQISLLCLKPWNQR